MTIHTCDLCNKPRREEKLCAMHARDAHLWFSKVKDRANERMLDMEAIEIVSRINRMNSKKVIEIIESYMAALRII